MLTLACSTLCFTQRPLDEALHRLGQLGFRYVDLGVQHWAHVSAQDLAQSGESIAASLRRSLKQHNLTLSTMNVGLDRSADASLEEQTAAVCALAASHSLSAICINAPPNDMPIESALVELRQLATVASHYGVSLCLETHVNCHTETPEVAVRLAESAPHLGLALDPSHFYAGRWQGRDFSATYPHTRIVHLRDAGNSPDQIMVPPGEGRVDFAEILQGLVKTGYAGPLSVEYIDTRVAPANYKVYVAQVTGMASLAKRILADLQAPLD